MPALLALALAPPLPLPPPPPLPLKDGCGVTCELFELEYLRTEQEDCVCFDPLTKAVERVSRDLRH